MLSEGRFRAHKAIDRIVPVAAQHEACRFVVVEEADDDAVADLDAGVGLAARCRIGCVRRARSSHLSRFGNAQLSVPLRPAVFRRRLYPVRVEHGEKLRHAAVGVDRKARCPAAPEPPPDPFEHALPRHVVRPALRPMILVPVAFDREAPVAGALNH